MKIFPEVSSTVHEKKNFRCIMFIVSTRRLSAGVSTKIHGVVKWFDTKKGFGFISSNQVSGDVFVHQSSIVSATGFRSLKDGMEVSFVVKPDRAGKNQAYDVTLPNGTPVQVGPRKDTVR